MPRLFVRSCSTPRSALPVAEVGETHNKTHNTGVHEEKAPQRKSLQGFNFTESGRRDSNPRPPEPHTGLEGAKIRQNVAFTRCFGRPLLYQIDTKWPKCSMFLPHFLPHLSPASWITDLTLIRPRPGASQRRWALSPPVSPRWPIGTATQVQRNRGKLKSSETGDSRCVDPRPVRDPE